MKPQDIYKYCLRCGGGLKKLDEITFQCEKCKNKMFVNPEPVASVILEKGEDQILLAKRAIEPAKDTWDVPGGFIKPGETAEQAGVREIKEELGITINIIDTIGTVAPQDYTYQGIDNPHLVVVLRTRLQGNETIKPSDDVSEYKFIDKESALRENIQLDGTKMALELYLKRYTLKPLE